MKLCYDSCRGDFMKQPNLGQQELSSLQDDILLENVSYKQYQSDVLFDIH